MTRQPLDLRGLSMTELMTWDEIIGNQLSALDLSTLEIGFTQYKSDQARDLLADRRQIREEMERRRLQDRMPPREAIQAIIDRRKGQPDPWLVD